MSSSALDVKSRSPVDAVAMLPSGEFRGDVPYDCGPGPFFPPEPDTPHESAARGKLTIPPTTFHPQPPALIV